MSAARMPIRLSVIVPFHRNLRFLERCLEALTPLPPDSELLIAADAPVDDCRALAACYGAQIVDVPGPSGPAVARNRAAEVSEGDVLVFVDADVVIADGALPRLVEIFDAQPETAAVFGAYDETPAAPGFISQYKNLAHSFIHQSSARVAQTFWAGFGAVRRESFERVGGFDERFARPSVEDIELGYRLTGAGHRVLLDPSLRACHLKRWTLASMVVSDVRDRGVPWTQLILRFGRFNSDLNLKSTYRACVVLAYLILLLAGLAVADWRFALPIPAMMGGLVLLSPRYYRFFYQRRGWWFVLRVFPLHYLYHLYNGLSFAVGTALFLTIRRTGAALPWALPIESWTVERARSTAQRARALGAPRVPAPLIAGRAPQSGNVLGV
jgi:cellulose synthase/poly-beta-1,6-N-acetylglucosamine synthase-like glycosyltransferase